jgi:hypothetical protein
MANIPNAYLEAVDEVVSIHGARQLYFTEGTRFFENKEMFSFKCESDCCGIPITHVNMFADELTYSDESVYQNSTEKKRSAYFKAKRNFADKHDENCPYSEVNEIPKKNKRPKHGNEDPVNDAVAPTEMLLTRRKSTKNRKVKLLPMEEDILASEIFNGTSKRKVSKTTSLNHVAEEWMHMGTANQRRKHPLSIADKQGNYSDCFKEVAYFHEVVSNKIILKGNLKHVRITDHFISIKFQWNHKKEQEISLYIPPETLKAYHKKKWFLRYIRKLQSSNEMLIAFFIPEKMTPIESIKHNSLGFRVETLDHLAILIDNRK